MGPQARRRLGTKGVAGVLSASILLAACASRAIAPATPPPFDSFVRPQRDGTFRLRETTRVGALVLEAGRYELSHRLDRDSCVLRATEVRRDAGYGRSGRELRGFVGEVPCRVEVLEAAAADSSLFVRSLDGERWIVWVEQAGASVRLLPE